MLRIIFCLALIWLAPACAGGQPTVLVVGDSLSAAYGMDTADGWVALLERRLREHGHPHAVVNASQSGATSRGALALLPRALELHEPEIVIIEIGGNDGLRGLPVPALRRNLERMIELSRAAGAHVIVPAMQIPPNYGARYTQAFHDAYREVTADGRATLVLGFLERVALDEALMQPDGIHPNERAQPLLLEVMWPAIESALAPRAARHRSARGAATATP